MKEKVRKLNIREKNKKKLERKIQIPDMNKKENLETWGEKILCEKVKCTYNTKYLLIS